jgi:hypothetical protein
VQAKGSVGRLVCLPFDSVSLPKARPTSLAIDPGGTLEGRSVSYCTVMDTYVVDIAYDCMFDLGGRLD